MHDEDVILLLIDSIPHGFYIIRSKHEAAGNEPYLS